MDVRKRVDIVKVKLCKEDSILYKPRRISNPSDAVELVRSLLDDTDREHFIVIALNVKNEPIVASTVSIGTINSSLVHPREVFKIPILSNGASIIIAHNHPSKDGNPLNGRNVLRSYKRLLAKLGIDEKNFHCLRHTYASKLFERGVRIKTVQSLLGHSDISITSSIYIHIMPSTLVEAASEIEDVLNDYLLKRKFDLKWFTQ